MDYFFNILRKSLVLTLMLVFGFVFTYVPQYFNRMPVAEAFLVTEVGPAGVAAAAAAAAAAVSATANTAIVAKEFSLDGIAFMIGKAIISSLIGNLIKWINSGFKGKPAFVQDFKRFLLDAADRGAGEYIKSLGGIGSFICSPFQLDIQIALAVEYQQAREHEEEEDECRISGIVDNLEDFYTGTFSESSLEDFITITSSPKKYTPYGQLLTARTAMRVRIANEKGQVLTEADWGGGFLSGKICEMVPGSTGKKEKCVISKPGKILQEALSFNLDTGRQSLVEADEINELIAALIGQLANQAITGAAGLLGLTPGTGYTDTSFGSGSYVDAAIKQSSNLAASTSAANISALANTFSESLVVQDDAVAAANQAIPALLSYKNNLSNPQDKRDLANAAYQSAVSTREKALSDIPKISTIQNEFLALKAEDSDPNTTLARKQAIAQRIAVLQSNFLNIGAISRSGLDALKKTWVPPAP